MATLKSQRTNELKPAFAIASIILGLVGLVASFELLTEYIKTLQEPNYSPNCNFSVLVTCGPNMGSWQGSVFGFSNTILGLASFMAPIILGFAILAGARLKSWFYGFYTLALLFAYIFVAWLQYQSIFGLNTLCPWCMVTWLAVIPLWWVTLGTLLKTGNLFASAKAMRIGETIAQWSWVIILLNVLLVAAVAQFKLNWLFTEFGIGSY